MKKIKLYLSFFAHAVKSKSYSVREVFFDAVLFLIKIGVLAWLYSNIYRLSLVDLPLTLSVTLWSMCLYFIFMLLDARRVATVISSDIKSGAIEMMFVRPINYLTYRFWTQAGSGAIIATVVAFVSFLALYVIVGIPSGYPLYLLVVNIISQTVICFVIIFLIYAIIGLLSFWVHDIKPAFWITDKAVMILGGAFVPVAFYPKWVQDVAMYSPFGVGQFVTRTVYSSYKEVWQELVAIQLVWVCILFVSTVFVYRIARRRVEVNGG